MKAGQCGYTLLEVLAAAAILVTGAGVLWHEVQVADEARLLGDAQRLALLGARTELDRIRLVPKFELHDTLYRLEPAAPVLFLHREVFDSASMLETLPEVDLDAKGSPVYLRRPLEVRVRVFAPPRGEEVPASLPTDPRSARILAGEWTGAGWKRLAAFSFLIPDYQWR